MNLLTRINSPLKRSNTEKVSNEIILMLCFARSGGTLLNQTLGILPNNVVMSEVSPIGGGWGENKEKSNSSIHDQARSWYGYDLSSKDFRNATAELYAKCQSDKKTLIIRDWVFVSFYPHSQNDFQPECDFLTLKAINGIAPITPFAMTRNSVDILLSLGLDDQIETFFEYYLKYVEAITGLNCAIVKYEELCSNPTSFVKSLCKILSIQYTRNYKKFYKFTKVNGDTQRSLEERLKRGSLNKIKPRDKRYISSDLKDRIIANQHYREANRLLNYPIEF